MSTEGVLTLKHIYGLKGDVADNIHYIDESRVCFPAGYNIVSYNIDKKNQKLLCLGAKNAANSDDVNYTGDISAMTVSSQRHQGTKGKLLAVAERGEDDIRPRVNVYDLSTFKKKNKVSIETKDVVSHEYVSMDISPDCKMLLTQGGAPDWMLVNWQWEKGRPLQYARVSTQSGAPIHQVSYCPTDPSVVCVTGNGVLRFLHCEQNEFKSIPFSMGKREPQNYLCHCWLDDRILVGTDTGDILLFENAEFRGVLESSPSDGKSVDSLCAFSKGFVAGCDEGVLYVFEKDEKEIYKQSKTFQIDNNYVKIKNLAISPSEDNVVCTLENNQAFVLGLLNTDILKSEEMSFEPLSLPFHHSHITGIDTCTRKPFVVTCGLDRSVRVWNYLNHTMEVMGFFNEPAYSVAFHPSGLHVLVGFADNLRLCNLRMNEISPYHEVPIKNCRECRFSNGGQYFAAANGSVVQLFQTYTCEMMGSFNVHKAKVRSIWWSHDDSSIITAGMDGCMFEWRLADGSHNRILKQECVFTSAVMASDNTLYAAVEDGRMKVVSDNELIKEVDGDIPLTSLAICHMRPGEKDNLIFAGTQNGAVRVYPLPLQGEFVDINTHSAPITRMCISGDDSLLLSVGEDGVICIYELASSAIGHTRKEHAISYAEEILVSRTALEEKLKLIQDLQNKVEELHKHNALQLQMREIQYQEKLREVTEKFSNELEVDLKRHKALEEEKEAMENAYALKVDQANALQQKKLEELDYHHSQKLLQEKQRYEQLLAKDTADRETWEQEVAMKQQHQEKEKEQLIQHYIEKLDDEEGRMTDLIRQRATVHDEFEETKVFMEDDADTEIDDLKAMYDKKLTQERMQTLRLKDQNGHLKKRFVSLREEINDNLDDLQKMNETQQTEQHKIENLKKDIEGHKKEISERESTIKDKIHRIFELKKKNQELEKFKFVLDYKITELKRQIQPRKQEMKMMAEQIAQMQAELKSYEKKSIHLVLDIRELHLKMDGMNKEVEGISNKRTAVEKLTQIMKAELHQVMQNLNDSSNLKEGIKKLYQRFVTSAPTQGVSDSSNSVEDMHRDHQRQRHYLEKSVDSLNDKLTKDMQIQKKDHQRIMQENIILITEINNLRREIKHIKDAQKARETLMLTRKKKKSAEGGDLSGEESVKRQTMEREMEMQQEQIRALKNQLRMLHSDLEDRGLMSGSDNGMGASARLPPLEEGH